MEKIVRSYAALLYDEERKALDDTKVSILLEQARKWQLGPILQDHGTLFFPHTYLSFCGHQIAAVAQACLDTKTDQIVVLGVLHPLLDELQSFRKNEQQHLDLTKDPLRRIITDTGDFSYLLSEEYSLDNFLFLLHEEAKRRGVSVPKTFVRYPFGVLSEPSSLQGILELEELMKDSVVVATSDFCHHGKAYNRSFNGEYQLGKAAEVFARDAIEKGFLLLNNNDYDGYRKHCLITRSDSVDVAIVLHHLLGCSTASILDLTIVDTAPLFEGSPTPSWVSAALVAYTK